jgi:hypothetical protein
MVDPTSLQSLSTSLGQRLPHGAVLYSRGGAQTRWRLVDALPCLFGGDLVGFRLEATTLAEDAAKKRQQWAMQGASGGAAVVGFGTGACGPCCWAEDGKLCGVPGTERIMCCGWVCGQHSHGINGCRSVEKANVTYAAVAAESERLAEVAVKAKEDQAKKRSEEKVQQAARREAAAAERTAKANAKKRERDELSAARAVAAAKRTASAEEKKRKREELSAARAVAAAKRTASAEEKKRKREGAFDVLRHGVESAQRAQQSETDLICVDDQDDVQGTTIQSLSGNMTLGGNMQAATAPVRGKLTLTATL